MSGSVSCPSKCSVFPRNDFARGSTFFQRVCWCGLNMRASSGWPAGGEPSKPRKIVSISSKVNVTKAWNAELLARRTPASSSSSSSP